jgi:AcrR family transcriptional regulator
LIDAHGVERFSVRDLARALQVYPTALYWYVPSRNALVAGAVALALADLPLPDPAGEWTAELRQLLNHYRAAVRRHPHIAPVLGAQLVSNEGANLALVDRLLALLEGAGFRAAGCAGPTTR